MGKNGPVVVEPHAKGRRKTALELAEDFAIDLQKARLRAKAEGSTLLQDVFRKTARMIEDAVDEERSRPTPNQTDAPSPPVSGTA